MKVLKIASTILLGLAGLIGVIFLAAYLHLIPQFKVLMVLSGSMKPTLKTGGIAVVVPSKNYLPGNIISFYQDANKKNIVTHRILFKQYPDGVTGKPLYLTGGDANKNVDQVKIKDDQIIGKLLFSLPYLGYLANFVKTPAGLILLIIVPATIIVYEELKRVKKELQEGYQKHKEKRALANFYYQLHFHSNLPETENGLNKLLVLIPVFFAAIIVTSLSVSFFSDRETTLGNSFQAGTWITPTPPPISNHLVINEFYSDPVDPHRLPGHEPESEWIELYNPTYQSISLAGWSLSDNHQQDCYAFPSISIPPLGFAIFSPFTETVFRGLWSGIPSGTVFIQSANNKIGNGLANNGDRIIIKSDGCNGTTVVDQLGYGNDTTTPVLSAPNPGHSKERDPDGKDTNSASDFVDRTNPTPGS